MIKGNIHVCIRTEVSLKKVVDVYPESTDEVLFKCVDYITAVSKTK